jgi:DNA replication and repair protein RecF
VHIEQVTLSNFRNYVTAELRPTPKGITLLYGENGAGKTNVLEAIAYLSSLRSFRRAPAASLVRNGEQQAVLRATADREGRSVLVEAELNLVGKDRVRLNRQPVRRTEDLVGAVLTTVFSPDDIEVVKGAPQSRREYLDDLLAGLHPRHAAACGDLERSLKQRNALLRSAGGSLGRGMAATMDVWDAKFASAGEVIARARGSIVSSLEPEVDRAYRQLSRQEASTAETGRPGEGVIALRYERSWQGPLLDALRAARAEDLRRGSTTLGPQRDDLYLSVNGLAARTQASQGEQRSLALALRLGGHCLVTVQQGSSPVLLLDDIFSELDPGRCQALASCLPEGQVILTTAGAVPEDLAIAQRAHVEEGTICQVSSWEGAGTPTRRPSPGR